MGGWPARRAEHENGDGRRRSVLSPASRGLLVGLAFLGLYLALPTALYSYDAVGYAAFIHRATYFSFPAAAWHNYHILYMPLGILLGRGLRLAGFAPDLLVLMQAANALFAAAALAVFHRAAEGETGRPAPALLATALLGTGYAWWYYATDPEPYPACFLLLLLSWMVTRRAAGQPGWRLPLAAGTLHGLAFGFHVAALVAAPAAAWALLAALPGSPARGRRLRNFATYAAAALGIAGLPYAIRILLWEGSAPASGALNLLRVSFGREQGRYLRGAWDPWSELLGTLQGFVPGPGIGPAALRTSVAVALVAVVSGAPWLLRRHPAAARYHLAWLAASFTFFSAYNVGSWKFVSFHLAPLFFLLAMGLAAMDPALLRRTALTAVAALAALTASANFTGRILPESVPENNEQYRRAVFLREHTEPADLVMMAGIGENVLQKVYLPYFAGRAGLVLDTYFRGDAPPEEVVERIAERVREQIAAGGKVYALSEVVEDGPAEPALRERHGLPPGILGGLVGRFHLRPHASLDDRFRLYALELAPGNGGPAP